jgi:nicotinic acid mononucleotide adenylyltransferase
MLTADEPNVDFTLALGSDTFIDLARGKWKRTEDVFKLVGHRIVVFRRKGTRKVVDGNGGATTSAEEANNDYAAAATSAAADISMVEKNTTYEDDELFQELIAKWQIINPTTHSTSIHVVCIPTSLTNVSSSAARQCTNLQDLKEMVSQSVLDYIVEHKLYAFSEHQEEKEGR